MSVATDLLGVIHETGYWRVVIHPTVYDATRIASPEACRRLIEESTSRLRGWDYPHINRNDLLFGDTWIQSQIAWANHVELWRFFQSGQFVHHRALTEDRQPPGAARELGSVTVGPGSPA